MIKNKKHQFKANARLFSQLGEQLIKTENIAITELVKNAYDADAKNVIIKLQNIDVLGSGIISIEDDGTGMTLDTIENVWLVIGSDKKREQFEKEQVTALGRLPIGEKGIGRFGAHKLGNKIELITRAKDSKEICLIIDWQKIKDVNFIEDLPVEIKEREPELFKGQKTGTCIIISDLRTDPWQEHTVKELHRAVVSLNSPFETVDSFSVEVVIEGGENSKNWLENVLEWEDIKKYSLFRVYSELEGEAIKKFKYEFTPWKTMDKIQPRTITEEDKEIKDSKIIFLKEKNKENINLNSYMIGPIKMELFIFDRDAMVLNMGLNSPEAKGDFKEYLDMNGGIRVYRDGLRVYDYGELGNDWLGLDSKRVNVPAKRLSNNIVIGAVYLNRKDSSGLIEKSNREGFLDSDSYKSFVSAVNNIIERVENFRQIDKSLIRNSYGPNSVSEPVLSSLNDLRDVVDRKVDDEKIRTDIGRYLNDIEKNYKEINEILLKSAGAGLNMGIAVHEIEKVITELEYIVKKEEVSQRAKVLIDRLSKLIGGYSLLIRRKGKRNESPAKLIENSLFNVEFRFKAHQISVIDESKNYVSKDLINCTANLVIGSIMNIIDNSIWWLENRQNKKMYFSVSEKLPGYLSIIIADNGPGFALATEQITKPFVTNKPNGMGLGLHITQQIMQAHDGKLLFPKPGDFPVPEEFKKGAITVLAFKIEIKHE